MLQINYDAIRIPYSDGVKRNAKALMVIGRFSILLQNRTSGTSPKALYSSVLKLEMYVTKKRHVTSLELVRDSTKEGANKGSTYTFWKLSLDPGLNLPVE